MTLPVRTLSLPTGVSLQYVEQGNAAGVPVILLHGVTDSWRSFAGVLPHLPPTIRAMAVSQRGHGDSSRPAAGYRAREFAADIRALLDALAIGQAVVVGHSMGATNALRFAIDYPERTLGLVLAACFIDYGGNPDLVKFWQTGVATLTDPIDPGFVREFQESTLGRPLPEMVDAAVAESLKLPARVWRDTFAAFFEDENAAELGRVQAPTLILWGDRDVLSPRDDQHALAAGIADAGLVVYEGVGHAIHWEEPARFARDVGAFVAARTA